MAAMPPWHVTHLVMVVTFVFQFHAKCCHSSCRCLLSVYHLLDLPAAVVLHHHGLGHTRDLVRREELLQALCQQALQALPLGRHLGHVLGDVWVVFELVTERLNAGTQLGSDNLDVGLVLLYESQVFQGPAAELLPPRARPSCCEGTQKQAPLA